eukprot:CAMPEP_0195104218 /NCGR_PEP_ID=MMETSP0448-20130528/72972_1 /TAXON_ID=66468 /ORGANISM="Heterocapsa triquestra, Strain CCMP 448" /LENGTH=40 /DNA_ID= /DNA_START= /DNA_END= /DNA_ORIENTATION=
MGGLYLRRADGINSSTLQKAHQPESSCGDYNPPQFGEDAF